MQNIIFFLILQFYPKTNQFQIRLISGSFSSVFFNALVIKDNYFYRDRHWFWEIMTEADSIPLSRIISFFGIILPFEGFHDLVCSNKMVLSFFCSWKELMCLYLMDERMWAYFFDLSKYAMTKKSSSLIHRAG